MRSLILTLLPAAALAAEQAPLLDRVRNWFSAATSLIPSAVPTAIIPNPLDAGAAKVAELVVHPLNFSNWKDVLEPAGPSITGAGHEWIVYVYGNDSCRGGCLNATKAWNTSTAILSSSANPPSLASINCDTEGLLCSLWDVKPPSIYHIAFPADGALTPTMRYIPLNQTAITASSLSAIHTAKSYELTKPYTGAFQPWTGWLTKAGVAIPLAYFMNLMAKLPSWAPMVIVSLLSRALIRQPGTRGMPRGAAGGPTAPAPAAPAPAPAGGK